MNNDLPASGSTRRSFIKKSVVTAVAASCMTIFSGLVNAADETSPYIARCDAWIGAGGCVRLPESPIVSKCTVLCDGQSRTAYCFESKDSGPSDWSAGSTNSEARCVIEA